MTLRYGLLALVLAGALLTGCRVTGAAPMSQSACNVPPEVVEYFPNAPCLTGTAVVELVVNGRPITLEIMGKEAPLTAGNFVDLVQRGFYNNLSFHRVVKQPQPFVVQGGDPKGNGTGGFIDPQTKQERVIPLEITPQGDAQAYYGQTFPEARIQKPPALLHERGALAMARSQNPNSASSQFYITLAEQSFLDGNYAVFGKVTAGMDVVDGIKQGDKITSAKVISGAEYLTTVKKTP
ncbi:MAG: peptidylprolyl isomerase [Gloeomargaritaceae cyanobacterium C42_A2020_066]|nr:peptidylprolyl isomerase [Gloeomargaritaceae cyanobacterium C42_A2020_066]